MIRFNKLIVISILLPIFLLSCAESKSESENTTKIEKLDATTFNKNLSENSEVQLIDVRTPDEFNSGHIANALNINIYDSNFDEQISKLDKDKPVMVYCRSGGRSATAADKFKEKGFKNISDLEGGITAWMANDLDVVTNQPKSEGAKGMSIQKYNEITSNPNKLVLVDFNAEWCGPCKKLSPILDKLAKEYNTKFELIKIDVDLNPEVASNLKVQGLPTLKLYKNGKEVWEYLGLTDEQSIKEILNKHS